MQLAYTILYVDEVARSLAFYESAFGLETRLLHESGDWGELETGGTTLAFCARHLMANFGKQTSRANPDSPCFEVAFTVEDVSAAVQRAVAAGAKLESTPQVMPWGQTVAYVSDLNGVLVELCSSMG